jgi:hypothetical protein
MPIPINYGPRQKFLVRIQQDPDLTDPEVVLPRMAFELTGVTYDGTRKLTKLHSSLSTTDFNSFNTAFSPAPYNLEFELNIITKYQDDGNQIVEQILPYFKPSFTPSVKLIDELDEVFDIPVVLNSVTHTDTYEGSFQQRRAIIWTLKFTVKGYFFGPTTPKKIIKFVTVNTYSDTTATTPEGIVTVQPGLDANGNPTTIASNSIPYANIAFDDSWAYIVTIE